MKLAVAPERAVAGDAASTRENHALTLGSRAFGSVEDSRTSLGGRHFGSGPDGRTRSFESVLGANVDRLRVFLLR